LTWADAKASRQADLLVAVALSMAVTPGAAVVATPFDVLVIALVNPRSALIRDIIDTAVVKARTAIIVVRRV
jgi:hypothetical protein